jgi:hypothetical protein
MYGTGGVCRVNLSKPVYPYCLSIQRVTQTLIRRSGRLIVVGITNARVDSTISNSRPLLSTMLVIVNAKQTNRRDKWLM